MEMHLHHINPVDHITLGLLYPRSFLSFAFFILQIWSEAYREFFWEELGICTGA